MKYLIALILSVCTASAAELGLSLETLGVIKHANFGAPTYGAGVDVGYKFNSFVTGHIRAIGYETDNWRGSVVDEGSLLVQARLLSSDRLLSDGTTPAFSLSAIGGGDRDFVADIWGLSVGLRGEVNLTKNLGLFVDSRVQAWLEERSKALNTGAGLRFSF